MLLIFNFFFQYYYHLAWIIELGLGFIGLFRELKGPSFVNLVDQTHIGSFRT